MRWACALVVCLAACGDNVASQLVRVSGEPPGSHCASGGTAVAVGLDRNGDGTLQDSEVEHVDYVCDGSDGPSGEQVLVETRSEPPGTNCAAGGLAIRVGLDADNDQQLDDAEVQHVSFVCNADGHDALVETRPEPPGSNCSLGGTAILVGIDLDDDAMLDDAEITGTSFLCNVSANATFEGSYTINNTLDLALIAGVTTITGVLAMGTRLPAVELPALENAGAVFLRGEVITLPALRTVGGIASFGECHQLAAPLLESVGGNLGVGQAQGGPALTTVDLPSLRTIGGDVFISTELVHLRMPLLETVANVQMFWPDLTELDLSRLQHVGQLTLDPAPLAAVSLPALIDASGLTFGVAEAASIDLPSLTTVGPLRIVAPVLTGLQMPAITTIGGPVDVFAPQFPVCQIDAILAQASYTGPRTIEGAPCP